MPTNKFRNRTVFARIGSILARRGPLEIGVMALDRLLRPFGISALSFSRFAAIQPPSRGNKADAKFEEIAAENLWGSAESLSGQGSEIKQSAHYRKELVALLRDQRFRSMFDAPCGDMNWMRLVLNQSSVTYRGGDISRRIIELNKSRYPQLEFCVFDITTDKFPAADVWHCRDCVFHLAYADIWKALANFVSSDIPFALITSHTAVVRNVDVATGGWRYLNLERAPFNFPKPITYLSDYRFGDLPRKVGLWRRPDIAQVVSRMPG